jgi:hypothetical protein
VRKRTDNKDEEKKFQRYAFCLSRLCVLAAQVICRVCDVCPQSRNETCRRCHSGLH